MTFFRIGIVHRYKNVYSMKIKLLLAVLSYTNVILGQQNALTRVATIANVESVKISDENGTMLVSPLYDETTVLHNPLNGWVMYAGRTAEPSYWDKEYYVSDIGTSVKVKGYASAGYIRTSWSSLNPADGVYAWRNPNSQIGRLINGAKERGLPIAFRIVVDGRDQGMNTPRFVFDAGAQYYIENSSFPDRLTPIPQDPIFKKYYAKFIEAFAQDFNNPDEVAFIDAYGFGKWGEAHNVVYADPKYATAEDTEIWKEEVLEWVTDLYTKNFTHIPLIINYHRLIGHPESWGEPHKNSEKLLEIAINKGYSLRQDAFGMTDYYQAWEKMFADKWRFKRPILMEGGWITAGAHRYWLDSSKNYRKDYPEDVRQGEFDTAADAHVNMMDFRAGDTDSWFEKAFPLVQRFVSEGGYRLYPDQVYLPTIVKSGKEISISHRWQNMGWGYLPNNIPQWNFKYEVAFALLDEAGKAKKVFFDQDSEPADWLKGSPVNYIYSTRIDVPVGRYFWAVAIIDTTRENRPAIQLAVKGDMTPEGWLKLTNTDVK